MGKTRVKVLYADDFTFRKIKETYSSITASHLHSQYQMMRLATCARLERKRYYYKEESVFRYYEQMALLSCLWRTADSFSVTL